MWAFFLCPNSSTRLFQRRDKREERKEKEAFLLIVEKQFDIKRIRASSKSNKKWRKYLFYRPFTKIDKFRQKLVDFTFSLFTLHSSLFTNSLSIFGGSNK